MRTREDLTGRTYGHFTVEGLAYVTNYQGYWWCRCVCGKRVAVYSGNFKSGKSTSCGCIRDALCSARSITHGLAVGSKPTVEYRVWQGIVKRCYNPKNRDYKNYGGRGITVCDRWRHDPAAFVADVGKKPSSYHSIDRIDNAKGYSPENVRWATQSQQARNRRSNRLIEYQGQWKTLAEWSEITGIKSHILIKRLHRGWSVGRTMTDPPMKNQFRYR